METLTENSTKTTDGSYNWLNWLPFTKIPGKIIAENKQIVKDKVYHLQGKKIDLHDHIKHMQESVKIFGGETIEEYQNTIDQIPEISISHQTKILIENRDCLEVALEMTEQYGESPLLLNLCQRRINDVCGKWYVPYLGTQEEYIERISGVYRLGLDPMLNPILKEKLLQKNGGQLPKHHVAKFAAITHENVPIIRDSNYNLLFEPKFVDVCAAGAIDMRRHFLRENESAEYIKNKSWFSFTNNGEEIDLDLFNKHTEMKIRIILAAAILTRHEYLVLGALGCGAFKNPKQEVAKCFKRVLNEPQFKGRFKIISFAILGNENYNIFKKEFEN